MFNTRLDQYSEPIWSLKENYQLENKSINDKEIEFLKDEIQALKDEINELKMLFTEN